MSRFNEVSVGSDAVVHPDRDHTIRIWPPMDQSGGPSNTVLDGLITNEDTDRLHVAIENLFPLRDQVILRQSYGIGTQQRTLKQIGDNVGLSHEGVRKRLKRSLSVLRNLFRS